MGKTGIVSFNAGELTPLIDARTDLDKYSSGCRTLQNMIPRIYGAAERRPGTKFIKEVKDSTKKTMLVSFEYSSSVAYTIEVGDLYMRFYTNGGILLDPTVPVEVVTPYLEADLFELQFKQSNDVMWITHKDYAPRKLTRTSSTAFSLDTITFTTGPFKTRNDIAENDGVTMTPTAITGNTTLVASSATFLAGHVGALFELVQPRVNTDTSGSKSATGQIGSDLEVKGAFSFNTHGTWTATVELQRKADGVNWETFRTYLSANDRNIQLTATEEESDVDYRIQVTNYTSGTIQADLTVNTSTQSGVAKVTAFNSTTNVDITVLKDFASTDATKRWAEGSWSAVQGYPRTFTFLEERGVYAGTTNEPQTLWFSETEDFENFEAGTNDDDSFSVTINSEKRNAIQWISTLEALVIGTTGGEWRLQSTTLDAPVTPTNFSISQQSSYGSTAIQATGVNDVVLFVDRPARKIREMVFDDNIRKYRAPDLTALAEHVTDGGITDIAIQKNPESIIWMVTGDSPYLISLTYNREQDVLAASKHAVGGDGIVESVSVIPGTEEDEVWISVRRTINTASVRFVEQFQPWDYSSQETAWFTDSALSYSGVATKTLTGLDHLEGETVTVLGNGEERETAVVASGSITLNDNVTTAVVGLPYRYIVKPMKFNQSQEVLLGSIKKLSEIRANFLNTLGVLYGTDTSNLYDIVFPRPSAFSQILLYTGDQRLVLDAGFTADDDFIITGIGPYPCVLRSLTITGSKVSR